MPELTRRRPDMRLRCGQFDAAFSNAALHWMLDPERGRGGDLRAAAGPAAASPARWAARAISPILRGGIRDELIERGYPVPAEDPQWYPRREEFARRL